MVRKSRSEVRTNAYIAAEALVILALILIQLSVFRSAYHLIQHKTPPKPTCKPNVRCGRYSGVNCKNKEKADGGI